MYRRRSEQMLDELAEMSRQVTRRLREVAARGASPGDAARLLRAAAEAEADRDAERWRRLKAALASERRRQAFGLPSLPSVRSAIPPTATRR